SFLSLSFFQNSESVFRYSKEKVINDSSNKYDNRNEFGNEKNRFFVERSCDSLSQHLVRDQSATQPYCFITKDKFNHRPLADYASSAYGAYPTWGVDQAGHRTRAHYIGETVERLVNIDVYKRPLTNQPGRII